MREELLKGLSEEQIAKVKACKNSDEILKIAKSEGVELSEEQLDAVTGGCGTAEEVGAVIQCKYCNNFAVRKPGDQYFRCDSCGAVIDFSEYYQQ